MIIIANKPGQLANRLIVASHLIALSLEHNLSLYNPAFDEYTECFEGTKKGLLLKNGKPHHFFDKNKFSRTVLFQLTKFISKVFRRIHVAPSFFKSIFLSGDDNGFVVNSPENLKTLRSSKIIFLSGWLFRSDNIIQKHRDFIKDYFSPLKIHRENVNKTISPIKDKFKTLVGIHIRRKDYKTFLNGIYYYENSEYLSVMKRISSLFGEKTTAFLICSDEEIDLNFFAELNVFKGTSNFIEDIYTLAQCDYIAGPPSTYSMWASFYGEKPLYKVEDTNHNINREIFR